MLKGQVVVAGDIIDSSKKNAGQFMPILERELVIISTSNLYDIYRGDSFQVLIKHPEKALLNCLQVKTALKKECNLNVRFSIGIGSVEVKDKNLARSSGSALERSGHLLDRLKEVDRNLMVSSGTLWDAYLNNALYQALTYLDTWNTNACEIIYELITNPGLTQKEMGERLGLQQATVSRRLQRAYWKQIHELTVLFDQYYNDVRNGDYS